MLQNAENIMKMCIFVVLCVDEAYYFMCEYNDTIKLPNPTIKIYSIK
jgi:hypothetical protein